MEGLEGEATMLEQSGYRVNVNTKEGIAPTYKSVFGL